MWGICPPALASREGAPINKHAKATAHERRLHREGNQAIARGMVRVHVLTRPLGAAASPVRSQKSIGGGKTLPRENAKAKKGGEKKKRPFFSLAAGG